MSFLKDKSVVYLQKIGTEDTPSFYLAVDQYGDIYRDYSENPTLDNRYQFIIRKYDQKSGGTSGETIYYGDNVALMSLSNGRYASNGAQAACGFENYVMRFSKCEQFILDSYSYYGEGSIGSYAFTTNNPVDLYNKPVATNSLAFIFQTGSACFVAATSKDSFGLQSSASNDDSNLFRIIDASSIPSAPFTNQLRQNDQTITVPASSISKSATFSNTGMKNIKSWNDLVSRFFNKNQTRDTTKIGAWFIIIVVVIILLILLLLGASSKDKNLQNKKVFGDCLLFSDGTFECKNR